MATLAAGRGGTSRPQCQEDETLPSAAVNDTGVSEQVPDFGDMAMEEYTTTWGQRSFVEVMQGSDSELDLHWR